MYANWPIFAFLLIGSSDVPVEAQHYVKDRGASWRTAVRLASPQISVPSGSGEAGADEQFVAVFGQHLLDRSSAGGATPAPGLAARSTAVF